MMTLRSYQADIAGKAHELLKVYGLAYLCMEVRTGKTFTAFEAARLYGAKKVLFVTKLKAISSIQADFEGAGKPFALYVTNYEGVQKVETEGWDLVILDEAHCLGQYPTPAERIKQLKRICQDKPIIYLSGTPSPESYSQLYHQFWVCSRSPWRYPSFYKWHNDYGVKAVKYLYNRQIADYSKTQSNKILSEVEKYMLTMTQEAAGFEMPVEEQFIKVPMSDKVKWAVGKIRKDKIFRTQAGHVVLGDTAVKEMQKVHQLCSGTFKTEEGEYVVFDYTKAFFIRDKFEGQKIAIFYKYVAERAQLLAAFNPRVVDTPEEFNAGGKDAVLLYQYQSGREGTNLSTADCLVMYNPDFSAVSYWQARARLQHKDRKDPAKVYWVFTEGGIEEQIYGVVSKKKDFTLQHYRKLNVGQRI